MLKKLTHERDKITRWMRLQWVDLHPEWVMESLTKVSMQETAISASFSHLSLDSIGNASSFVALLEKAASKDLEAEEALQRYVAEGGVFYRIEQVQKIADRHLLTLAEAKTRGVMAQIVDRWVQAEYAKMCHQNPDRFPKKSLAAVKEEVMKEALAEVWSAIQGVVSRRCEKYCNQAFIALQQNPKDPRWIQGMNDPLMDQFKLETKPHEIQRAEQEEWMKTQPFVMMPQQWSSIHVPPNGDIIFFYCEGTKPHEEPILEQLTLGKQTLAADAQKYLAEQLIAIMQQQQSITIPVQKERE